MLLRRPFLLLALLVLLSACGGEGTRLPDLADAAPVGIEALTTPELREVAGLREGDGLFQLPGGESEGPVLVRVREEAAPLLFATDCAALAHFQLPAGWEARCLERTVGGVPHSGTFLYGTVD